VPRRKRRERAYRGDKDAEARVKARYSNQFVMMDMSAANFHRELPTKIERLAFLAEFRQDFLRLWAFIADPEFDNYPASTHYREPFRRPAEFYSALDLNGFDPVDVSSIPYQMADAVVAHERGLWWRAQKLPMTPAERTWLAEWAPPAQPEREEPPAEPGRKVLTFKAKEPTPGVLPEED